MNFEVLGRAGAMLRKLDGAPSGYNERTVVGRIAGIRRKTKGYGGQAQACSTTLCIRTAANVAVAYEDDTLYLVPADLP
ncbi:MAG TPA: hypothetical protein VGR45_10820 [Stellaceae bacterium]|nr:hypothetical protein [Stellaceae bacterium]